MKKSFKKALIVLGVVLLVGVLCVVAGVAMGGSVSYRISLPDRSVSTVDDYISNSLELDEFENITVYETCANVRVEYGEDYRVTYKYRAVDAPHIEVKDGDLFINVENTFERQASSFLDETLTFFDFGSDEANEMVITVPENAVLCGINVSIDYGNAQANGIKANSMQLYANCGNVTVNGGEFTGRVYCDAQNGNIAVTDLSCDSFLAVPYNSNMTLNSLKTGKIDICEANYANAEIKNCAADEFAMVTDSSNLTVDNMACDTFSINAQYSNADVTGLTAKKLNIDSESGNMDFELIGDKGSYGLDILPVNGAVAIDGEEQLKTAANTDSDYLIKAYTEYGNIDIDFIEE